MKKAYEAQIAQVMNGVIVKIGCKTFVGEISELKMLTEYYGGTIPDAFKKTIGVDEAYTGCDCPIGEAECTDECDDGGSITLPSFMNNCKICTQIIKVTNGYILVKTDRSAWIAKTKKELVSLLDV